YITQKACPMWVPLVENNELSGEGASYFVRKYLDELFHADPLIDTVVLGCTHYPLLRGLIRHYVPQEVKVIEQGHIVADSLKDYLKRHTGMEAALSKQQTIRYLTTEQPDLFVSMAGMFMGEQIEAEHISI
ncbi:MAG: glutamate racemase, partial [Odoribacter sp.]|nr:glutamate racemase [Odoribacter sp.]